MIVILMLSCTSLPLPDYEANDPRYTGGVGANDSAAGDQWLGPNPFDPDIPRLSFGLFYEGEATEYHLIDGGVAKFYIWPGGNSFTLQDDSDRLEGASSDNLVAGSLGWIGGGIAFEPSVLDMSSWTHLHISLKSTRETYASMTIGMISKDGSGPQKEANLLAVDYGFEVDGQWHSLKIPTADFAPVDLTSVFYGITLVAEGVATGDAVLIDDLYFTSEPE